MSVTQDIFFYLFVLHFHPRIGGDKQAMTPAIRAKIMATAISYGTGRDTLRCLALATSDTPLNPNEMDLEDSTKFVKFEQNLTFVGVVGMLIFNELFTLNLYLNLNELSEKIFHWLFLRIETSLNFTRELKFISYKRIVLP